jgi:hypothetical protein
MVTSYEMAHPERLVAALHKYTAELLARIYICCQHVWGPGRYRLRTQGYDGWYTTALSALDGGGSSDSNDNGNGGCPAHHLQERPLEVHYHTKRNEGWRMAHASLCIYLELSFVAPAAPRPGMCELFVIGGGACAGRPVDWARLPALRRMLEWHGVPAQPGVSESDLYMYGT